MRKCVRGDRKGMRAVDFGQVFWGVFGAWRYCVRPRWSRFIGTGIVLQQYPQLVCREAFLHPLSFYDVL